VVEAALEAVRPAADAKHIHLNLSLDSPVGAVSGDPGRLQQVVWNLLSNAMKFTPDGGTVEVRLEGVGSNACITIRDTGEGISEAFLPFVFDRFRQADSTFTRMHGGLGIGLAIVRHLVEMHGGSVTADSPGEDQGATFTVSLPLLTSRSNRVHKRNETGSLKRQSQHYSTELDGIRVMIVEDERDAREVLVAMLEHRGATVLAASSAAEAVDVLAHATNGSMPDVLVSDLGMPDEDGYSLLSRIRALSADQGGHVPAIALTALARPEDRRRALTAGFQVHLAKPVDASELVAVVKNLATPNH
jgi:CheY-like chemotaxis protein